MENMSTKENDNAIILTGDDMASYASYRKHREKILAVISSGAFELEMGKVEININSGVIHSIVINQMTYRRERSKM